MTIQRITVDYCVKPGDHSGHTGLFPRVAHHKDRTIHDVKDVCLEGEFNSQYITQLSINGTCMCVCTAVMQLLL